MKGKQLTKPSQSVGLTLYEEQVNNIDDGCALYNMSRADVARAVFGWFFKLAPEEQKAVYVKYLLNED